MNKRFNTVRKMAAPAALLALVGSAHAELPPSVATGIAGAQVDLTTAIGLLIGVAVAIWGLYKVLGMFGRK